MVKIPREKFKVEKTVFDRFTVAILKKFESDGFIEMETMIPLEMGKEANIFISEGKKGKIIVKIYRLENCDFNKMLQYIRLDPRVVSLKKRKRDVIFQWVKREFRNLQRAREGRVRVPKPIAVKYNVLLMDLIGEPALKVKDHYPKDPDKFYADILKEIKKLAKVGLVHADLSQFNILNFNEKPVFIDFSQSTLLESIGAHDYMKRDIYNINTFFKKLQVKDLKTQKDLF